jgi:serine/threonine-protein kinase
MNFKTQAINPKSLVATIQGGFDQIEEMVVRDRLPETWGDYDQLEFVAEGGMGQVYKAWHRNLKRFEAIKVMRKDGFPQSKDLLRFKFEAEAAGTLTHANIVSVYGSGEQNGQPFIAMQWVSGGNLYDRREEFHADAPRIAKILSKLARAVQYAHSQGILHRDLTPKNILLDENGEPLISDFGLAKRADSDIHVTATGVLLGTPQFMSPEQARGERRITIATDIFALGGILYLLLTGQPAYTGRNVPDVIKKITSEPPTQPRVLMPDVNPDLEAICMKCLEQNPRDRYGSAQELAEDLERCVAGLPVSVRTPGLYEWAVRELTKTPPLFNGYVWQVKISFALIILLSQIVITGLVQMDLPISTVWAVFVTSWVAGAGALWWQMWNKFTRLPTTEQHSVMIAIGYILGYISLTFGVVPFTGPARQILEFYPALIAFSAFSLFVVGTTHWGRFYLISLVVLMLSVLARLIPDAGPMILGITMAAIMLYWAWAIKYWFCEPEQLSVSLRYQNSSSTRMLGPDKMTEKLT